MSVKDFKASQVRTSKIIGSGSRSDHGGSPGLLIYSASSATDYAGGINTSGDGAMLKNVGTDVFLFVSGSKNVDNWNLGGHVRKDVTLFGGDVVVSGTMFLENLVAEVDMTTTGSVLISGSLVVSGGLAVGGSEEFKNQGGANGQSRWVAVKLDAQGSAGHHEEAAIVWGLNEGSLDGGGSGDGVIAAAIYESGGGLYLSSSNDVKILAADRGNAVLNGGVILSSSWVDIGKRTDDGDFRSTAGNDTLLRVTGTIGSRNTGIRGTAVFQGDTVISGSLVTKRSLILDTSSTAGSGNRPGATDDPKIIFKTGEAARFHVGIDDSDTDKFIIGTGGTLGASVSQAITIPPTLDDDSAEIVFNEGATDVSFRFKNDDGGDFLALLGKEQVVQIMSTSLEAAADYVYILSGAGGGKGTKYDPRSALDTNFFVSGSMWSKGKNVKGTAVFGGDVFVSGTAYTKDLTVTDDFYIGDDLFVSGSLAAGDLTLSRFINHAGDGDTYIDIEVDQISVIAGGKVGLSAEEDTIDTVYLGSGPQDVFSGDNKFDRVFIMSGGAPAQSALDNPANYSDTSFWVSGAISSMGTTTRGTAVFGGDVVVSGSFNVNDGTIMVDVPAAAAAAPRVFFMSGSPVLTAGKSDNESASLDVNFFVSGSKGSKGTATTGTALFGGDAHVSGSLTVDGDIKITDDLYVTSSATIAGNLNIAESIIHDGDTNTKITFVGADNIRVTAGGTNYINIDDVSDTLTINPDGVAKNTLVKSVHGIAITVKGATNQVFINSGSGQSVTRGKSYDEAEGADVSFYVSGSVGSKGTLDRGTAVFGGDVVISGTITDAEGGAVGGAVSGTFKETGAGMLVQTGSVSFAGSKGFAYDTPSVGHDTFFFVSGSGATRGTAVRGTAVFGGDLVVSGGLYVDEDTLVVDRENDRVGIGIVDPATTLNIEGTTRIQPAGNTTNFADFSVSADGALTIATTESDSDDDADITLDAEGSVNIDPADGRTTFKEAGADVFALDTSIDGTNAALFPLDTRDFIFKAGTTGGFPEIFRIDTSESTLLVAEDRRVVFGTQGAISGSPNPGAPGFGNLYISGAVMINSGVFSGPKSPNEANALDTIMFVSGAIGSKGTIVRGTTVFGGDVVISGTLAGGSPLKIDGGMEITGTFEMKPKVGSDAILSNPNGPVKVFGGTTLKLGTGEGIIHLLDLDDGAAGQIVLTGSGGTSARSVEINSPGTLYFTGTTAGSKFKGPITANDGISGSLTKLDDGTSYLLAGADTTITTGANGAVTIASSLETWTRSTAGRIYTSTDTDKVNIGGGNAEPGAKVGIKVGDAENIDGLFIDHNDTGGTTAFEIDSESTSGIALKSVGFKAGYFKQDIANGYAGYFTRNIAEGGNEPLVNILDNHTSNTQPALQIRQDGSGDILRMRDGADIIHQFKDGGDVALGEASSATDVSFHVSGGINTRGDTVHGGVADFGGDVVISGSAYLGMDSTARVFILSGAHNGSKSVDERGFLDVNFFVSGSVGSKGSAAEGTALFGGDLVVSGGLSVLAGERVVQISGAIGIGTSTPSQPLTIEDSAVSDIAKIRNTGNNSAGAIVTVENTKGGSAAGVLDDFCGALRFQAPDSANNITQYAKISGKIQSPTNGSEVGKLVFETATSLANKGTPLLMRADRVLILSGGAATSYDDAANADVGFYVSGTIGSAATGRFGVVRGTALFGGDVVTSGSVTVLKGVSGSITQLHDGRSYLAAGSNVTITSASNGQVVIAATACAITTVSGSTSVSGVTSIDFSRLGLLQNLGGNKVALTGTIGQAEEGSYDDGLFTSFNPETPIGTAIDKINEVLYYLAPSPSPFISHIGSLGLGTTAKLSLGSTTGLPSPNTYSYVLVAGSAGLGAAVDVNASYTVATSSNNIRMGVFGPNASVVTGELADTTAQDIYSNSSINYSGSTFGDADQGTLGLYVNGSLIRSISLTTDGIGEGKPGAGTDSDVDGNSTGFVELSTTGSGYQSNGTSFGIFQNRTGKFQVGTATQRSGWNYARVIHTVGAATHTTNYVEWFNATNGINPAPYDVRIDDVVLSGSRWISGVNYATGAHGKYIAQIRNFYDFVYAANTISFTATNTSIASQTVPNAPTSVNAHLADIDLTGSFQVTEASINDGIMASGSVSVNFSVSHPIKTNMSNTGSLTSSKFLLYSASQIATNQFEDFVYESYRITSSSYATQASVVEDDFIWNPELSLTASQAQYPGQADGLMLFGGKLVAPRESTDSKGDFRIFSASYANTGSGVYQPNYSGVTSGRRTFYRAFRNQTGAAARDFDLFITGTNTTITNASTTLDTGKIRVYAKLPATTDFLDVGSPFIYNSGSLRDGGYIGTLSSSIGQGGQPASLVVANHVSFGTGSIGANSYVVLAIEADASWTGSLDGINVVFPAVAADAVSAAPVVNELQIDTHSGGGTFANGRLSFGAAEAIAGYINVTGSTGLSGSPRGHGTNVDVNGDYTASTNNNSNKRYGIIDTSGGVKSVSGDINGDTNASGNAFSADSFSNGHEGALKLYVNRSGSGPATHLVDLFEFTAAGAAGSGTGQSLNANGSGFKTMSVATTGKDSDSLADFRYWYRTGEFIVAAGDQNSNGWNWAKVVHEIPGQADRETVYVEWVNDSNANNITINSNASSSFGAPSFYTQSGVKYFDTALGSVATGTVMYRATNVYSNVYANDNQAVRLSTLTNLSCQSIQITGSSIVNTFSSSLSSNGMGLPLISGDDLDASINITGSVTYTGGLSLPGDGSPFSGLTNVDPVATLTVKHPLDTNATSTVTINNFLAYTGSSGASNINTAEKFRSEHFRLQSGSYDTQAASGSGGWDTTKSLLSSDAGHQTGLLIYGFSSANGWLVSPRNSNLPQSGDFRVTTNLTSPENNVNYSGVANERNYYRAFKNNTTSDQAVITLTVKGSATLVPRTGAGSDTLGANDLIHIFIRIPGRTEWLDVAKAADGGLDDGDGALSGDRDSTIDSGGAANDITFSSAFVGGDPASDGSGEHVVLRVQASNLWTGNITDIAVTW